MFSSGLVHALIRGSLPDSVFFIDDGLLFVFRYGGCLAAFCIGLLWSNASRILHVERVLGEYSGEQGLVLASYLRR